MTTGAIPIKGVTKAPTVEQFTDVLHTISQRVASFLERRGLLERDEDNSYLTLAGC